MHDGSLIIAQPAASKQLVLMFHGVGASAENLAPLGQALAKARPYATIISVEAPHPSQLGLGKKWFSVLGVTEENRPQRIAEAMPLFFQTVQHWQKVTGLGAEKTVLIGFSQGAIMALEATQYCPPAKQLAQTIIALAGRFAQPLRQAPKEILFHLIHGEEDTVMLPYYAFEGKKQLQKLGGSVTLDLIPQLGHSIDASSLEHILNHLPSA